MIYSSTTHSSHVGILILAAETAGYKEPVQYSRYHIMNKDSNLCMHVLSVMRNMLQYIYLCVHCIILCCCILLHDCIIIALFSFIFHRNITLQRYNQTIR